MKTAHANLAAVAVGQRMSTRGLVAGKYIKRGREYVVVESTTYDEAGTAFRRSADHIMLSFERVHLADTCVLPTSSVVPWRASGMASAIEDEAADSACVTRKVVYQRALERSRFSDDSSHNDENAQRFGYPGALVSAYVLAGLGSEPMVRYFGGSWFTTGAIALTFIGTGVQQGDEVECRGVMTGSEACEGGRRVAFDLTMVKGGVIAVAGHASGVAACDAASSAGS